MQMSISLIQSISVMFLMILVGMALFKSKVVGNEAITVITKLHLYVSAPAAIFNSFQIELSRQTLMGLLLAMGAGIVCHVLFIALTSVLKKPLRLTTMERGSVIYSNAANLVIPLVQMTLGQEMVLYSCGYIFISTFLVWTHGKTLMSGKKPENIGKIFTSVNVIAIFAGLLCFILKLRLPSILGSTLDSLAATLAPTAMLTVGMVLAQVDLRRVILNHRALLVNFLRLIVCPLLTLLVIWACGITRSQPWTAPILMITMLAASAPTASSISQFAVLYDNEREQASIVNLMSVILCIVTMPLINLLYTAFAM